MKARIWLTLSISANVLAAIFLFAHINISTLSIIPLSAMMLMLFQAHYFKNNPSEPESATAYGSGYTRKEETELFQYASKSLILSLPLQIPFVFFFNSWIKLCSVLLYIFALICGPLIYRFKKK